MPCWWPYPLCLPGVKQMQRQYRKQKIVQKREEKRRNRCAKNLKKYENKLSKQLGCLQEAATGYCSSMPRCASGCTPSSSGSRKRVTLVTPPCAPPPCPSSQTYIPCIVSQSCGPIQYSPPKRPVKDCCCSMGDPSRAEKTKRSPSCPTVPSCSIPTPPCSTVAPCCKPRPPCPTVTCTIPSCLSNKRKPSVRTCNAGEPSYPPMPCKTTGSCTSAKQGCCGCYNRKRRKKRARSLSEMVCHSLFKEECKCTPRAECKRRRACRRPKTRNLCCRCLICWAVVGAIGYFAVYWIPILAAVIPPP